MTVNAVSARIAREHAYGYHDVRIAINRLCGLGNWTREEAEGYIEEVAARHGDLNEAVLQALESESEDALL